MKKSLFLGLGIAALALGGTAFALNSSNSTAPIETKAGSTTRLYLDMSGWDPWLESGAHYGIHTWNSANGDKYFGATKVEDKIYYAEVDLETYAGGGGGYRFTRFDASGTIDGSHEWDRGAWNSYASGINTFYHVTGKNSGSWTIDDQKTWSVVGASSGTWTSETEDIGISLTKRIDNEGIAFYSTSLSLNTGAVFKAKNSDDTYWGSNKFKTNPLTKSYLSIDEEHDESVSVTAGGTFEIYVKPIAGEIWIQVDSETEATTFASTFISSTADICSEGSTSADHSSALAAIWNTVGDGTKLEDKWSALSSGAKTVFRTGTANPTIKDAHDRYIHIMKRYSDALNDFDGGPTYLTAKTVNPSLAIENNTGAIIAIVGITLGAATLLGVTFAFRKRRQD